MSLVVGLRFDPRDARRLLELVERGKSEGLFSEQIGLFDRAAEDARIGEPMLVTCDNLEEARVLAHGFSLYGVTAPTIEQLSA